MKNIKLVFWGVLAVISLLWFAADPAVFEARTVFALRDFMMQYSGVLAISAMSIAMVLALRPRWPEQWLGGLDKMYRLHKWLGISALIFAVVHWLWSETPKWAIGLGLLARPERGERPVVVNPVEQFLSGLRDPAEGLGEWAFYAIVLLIAVALIKLIPYRLFFKTHRVIAVAYLVLVFHTVVLAEFAYWTSPLGLILALLLIAGSLAAVVVLFRRVAHGRQVTGEIVELQHYPGVRALESRIKLQPGWPGHQPGQFAFATSDNQEGAHPYTIASAWDPANPKVTFIIKALGDHTSRLASELNIGQQIKIEGPYGCFTFDDGAARQIWIGGGIGITPFVSRMKYLAQTRNQKPEGAAQTIDLFHSTAELDEGALARLATDATDADVRLHVLIDAKHGRLTGDRIREEVPDWRDASIWFCGPVGFGDALRADFAAHGLDVNTKFHQELFSMR
ncbi:putative ferric reductase [Hoeflea sp. IMCC20628]|uniref:ferredoxin reductase family protein n=1 Tax=Hoeflea sp. IMCC20628 TaxID=1620421 RepID=UPI00063AEBE4|nr:ferric reductase-like transmembrane domain-containing protein [Hoeflea sp. IMCC20628]AKI01136.1 putative ferric reductase [Hoeflea sp. IMCC20628]